MFDIVLHAGTEHPALTWIVVPSLLSFLLGLGIGTYSDRFLKWLSPQETATE